MTSQQFLILAIAAGVVALILALLYARRAGRQARPLMPDDRAAATEAGAADTAAATPAPDSPSPFLAAPEGEVDDLSRIKGIGPKLSARLDELGVYHYRQIAGWTPEQLAVVDSQLGNFSGRPQRDQWQAQAQLLAAGDIKAYERMHGKLGPDAGPDTGKDTPGTPA